MSAASHLGHCRQAVEDERNREMWEHDPSAPAPEVDWKAGDPCSACGSTDTYGYDGCGGCRTCHAHDADES